MQKKRKREKKGVFKELLPKERTGYREDALRHAIDEIAYGFDETIDEIAQKRNHGSRIISAGCIQRSITIVRLRWV